MAKKIQTYSSHDKDGLSLYIYQWTRRKLVSVLLSKTPQRDLTDDQKALLRDFWYEMTFFHTGDSAWKERHVGPSFDAGNGGWFCCTATSDVGGAAVTRNGNYFVNAAGHVYFVPETIDY